LNVCEDLWVPGGVPRIQASQGGAHLFVNLSASPFHSGKGQVREDLMRHRARQHGVYVVCVNLVGGQDELVFDGRSVAVAPDGRVFARARSFEEDLLVVHIPEPGETPPPGAAPDPDYQDPLSEGIEFLEEHLYLDEGSWPGSPRGPSAKERIEPGRIEPAPAGAEEVYRALLLGLRDYAGKNRFKRVVIGLSGGVDSALTAVLAADALGPGAVTGLAMPSPYSSPESLEDALELARRLGARCDVLAIDDVFAAYRALLAEPFRGLPEDVAEENLQARIRGNLLMAYANKFSALVLATGNKSELAVGYCTLYGDMAGGFAVIKDVLKTRVYELARWRNAQGPGEGPIPRHTLERPPSAELRSQQVDQDTLPPYPVLDAILELAVERDLGPADVVAAGHDPRIVTAVFNWLDGSEYKRRQAPPGVKLTTRAFGKDRRYPITNRYRPRPGGGLPPLADDPTER
jgi:NAD+ synthase (glutamine-hydrolysing)